MDIHGRPSWKLLLLYVILIASAITGIVAFQNVRLFLHANRTMKQLLMINLALENYYWANGCYPPQYLTDKQGKPAHSWRVLILPYMEYNELFKRYNFDEPWNGPHNLLLAKEMPEEYRSPYADPESTITPYVGIAGKNTPWNGTKKLQNKDLHRPYNSIIWFVEAANSDINWMEPRDIPIEQAIEGINNPRGGGIQSNYSEGLPVQLLFDNRTWIPQNISPGIFKLILSISDEHDSADKSTNTNRDIHRDIQIP